MKRRDFLLSVVVLVAGSAALTACGGSNSGYGGGGGNVPPGGTGQGVCPNGGGVTYTNPGHAHTTLGMSQAQVIAGVEGVYTLLGGSHTHTFNLTAEHFAALQTKQTVTGLTDIEGHGHLVDIVCV